MIPHRSGLQILSHCPPGFGGVERVAHSISCSNGYAVCFFQPVPRNTPTTPYKKIHIKSIKLFRYYFPFDIIQFINVCSGYKHIHIHLPSPGALLACLLIFLLKPIFGLNVSLHWHAFLGPKQKSLFSRFFVNLTNLFFTCFARLSSFVVTTSPTLKSELVFSGISESKLFILPCNIDENYEKQLVSSYHLREKFSVSTSVLHVVFVGRLESYKRLDWVVDSLKNSNISWKLHVIGAGALYSHYSSLYADEPVVFYGLLTDSAKYKIMSCCHCLVLLSDSCNEAFGIVQLEAMALAIPSISLNIPRSGMYWVSKTHSMEWSGNLNDLPFLFNQLYKDPELLKFLYAESRLRYINTFSYRNWIYSFNHLPFS
ncbi:glycosyltransferase [Synechococcus sp. TAK9802]|uniref:glycosyltransferase n=1 Tax=Synechococcus sp. TAK9802 TaxID=1442558 RepID=UPI0016447162|nr:glycosyltransferase [Synechococcus sp. TAK9802]QNI60500.1 putative alpha-glycosyltransferase/ family 4 [Synechococcus sp. TAK9802]